MLPSHSHQEQSSTSHFLHSSFIRALWTANGFAYKAKQVVKLRTLHTIYMYVYTWQEILVWH